MNRRVLGGCRMYWRCGPSNLFLWWRNVFAVLQQFHKPTAFVAKSSTMEEDSSNWGWFLQLQWFLTAAIWPMRTHQQKVQVSSTKHYTQSSLLKKKNPPHHIRICLQYRIQSTRFRGLGFVQQEIYLLHDKNTIERENFFSTWLLHNYGWEPPSVGSKSKVVFCPRSSLLDLVEHSGWWEKLKSCFVGKFTNVWTSSFLWLSYFQNGKWRFGN